MPLITRTIRFLAAAAFALGRADASPPILPPPAAPGPAAQPYVSVAEPVILLRHVRVIDGTGAPATGDRSIVIANGVITAIGGPGLPAPVGARVLDLPGRTVYPGLVGMHNHLFHIARPNLDAAGHSELPVVVPAMLFSAARLYLAAGVTTMRTAGSVEPYADLNLKREIDEGRLPGPHIDVTGPYLEGKDSRFVQMKTLSGPADARRTVAYWADQGVTSFKAYMHVTRAELAAIVAEAHRQGLKVTGHLCSVTYPEAVAAGIDNLEHGFFVNTQLDPGKQPDRCSSGRGTPTLEAMDPDGQAAKALIALLVEHRVALTSTLPVFEQFVPGAAPIDPGATAALSPQARDAVGVAHTLRDRADTAARARAAAVFARGAALERRFVQAGGLLMAGPDPTGDGAVVPGFGDQRGLVLLVAAGFTPEQAIHIASANGATYLGLARRIGSVAPGMNADLVVVRGDPSRHIADAGAVEIVFKDGVGYDPVKLRASAQGRFGEY